MVIEWEEFASVYFHTSQMSTKRSAEVQLRRKFLPNQKKQKLDQQDNNNSQTQNLQEQKFIELHTFKFTNSDQLCQQNSSSGFLVTCSYNKEKSCLRELLSRINVENGENFKPRIVKLACNGVVFIQFENVDVNDLLEMYTMRIIQGK
eukprot:TRINITY_DN22791_c2_g1_i3.p2 TRINITY_DN22791_c2_g1~~TRINITY_DN22791_c2_g1_i3.p2  ORF type:complete len:148 (+),score=9.06 TRINITY_DN22791_c2_g1_i3:93-536(+)